ncbi:hypothetical protein NDU88_000887 [Pleurodeles waltl]|uniref:Uncharacterized protein n=1 Tax=Pleurodeles waltl TaxID=8319 RepID=A0AAV7USM5_PLEWA|nr:hypothetical protein NDU88_000887 [Pleurodeles waltl]
MLDFSGRWELHFPAARESRNISRRSRLQQEASTLGCPGSTTKTSRLCRLDHGSSTSGLHVGLTMRPRAAAVISHTWPLA